MFKHITFAAVFVLTIVATASAQEGPPRSIALPGSVNASFGTVGPLEPGNTLGNATFEQGVTVWRRGPLFVIGFVDVTVRADTRGYTWNNTAPYLAGGKLVLAGRGGVFQAVVGMAGDVRQGTIGRASRAAHVNYWAGWQPLSAVALPGSVWATSGFVTASEPDNWITAAHVEQGVTVLRRGGSALVPFAGATVSADTEQRPWNNRGFVDAGLKVSTRVYGAAVDLGVAQRVTRAWQTGEVASAPVVFLNVWLGWMPR